MKQLILGIVFLPIQLFVIILEKAVFIKRGII